ncbi:hypothetical protein CDEF62S_03509 [Castellaniella defragrans]
MLFGQRDRPGAQLFFVDAPFRFLFGDEPEGFFHREFAGFRLALAQAGEHAAQLLGHFFHAGRRHDFHARSRLGDFDVKLGVVQLAFAQALAEDLPSVALLALGFAVRVARRRQQRVQDAVLGGVFGLGPHLAHGGFAGLLDRDFDQIADDGVHIASHVAHFGEFGGLDLDERRVGQACQAAGDLGLAHAGGAYHQDVLGYDFVAQGLGDLLAAPAVAQRHGDRTLGVFLADDVFVQFRDDFFGGHVGGGHGKRAYRVSTMWFWLV